MTPAAPARQPRWRLPLLIFVAILAAPIWLILALRAAKGN